MFLTKTYCVYTDGDSPFLNVSSIHLYLFPSGDDKLRSHHDIQQVVHHDYGHISDLKQHISLGSKTIILIA